MLSVGLGAGFPKIGTHNDNYEFLGGFCCVLGEAGLCHVGFHFGGGDAVKLPQLHVGRVGGKGCKFQTFRHGGRIVIG